MFLSKQSMLSAQKVIGDVFYVSTNFCPWTSWISWTEFSSTVTFFMFQSIFAHGLHGLVGQSLALQSK
jgi:hypothetical protein